ncbi:hypothetical protein KP509_04G111100 [Ceratopteris richardii]|uniref:Prenyltransferase alpha-alpha toroid domain-containing protein n=1 Tax=Ceratopteris richardii TaxID=49495 RepID=A0A8T2V3K8_CERRI|nr:hypothetical protein KP509_04G111100 [Ceratopteris richardii]
MDGNELFGQADLEAHTQFALFLFHGLPSSAQCEETNRITLAYFLISSLDLLRTLPFIDKTQIIDWVYAHQVLPSSRSDASDCFNGFRGSLFSGAIFSPLGASALRYDGGHLASTYSALAILSILGDNFSRVQKHSLLMSMRKLQQHDGSFTSTHMGSETDLRYIYCAVAISVILKDWNGIDKGNAIRYVMSCQSYDNGFGLSPGLESHGGATYCAIASLFMLGCIYMDPLSKEASSTLFDVKGVIKWCVQRQTKSGGYQGRSNKDPDACYAFWVAGSLHLLGAGHLCNVNALENFLGKCADKHGGFSKWPGETPDILHAYYGICGLSLLGKPQLKCLCCKLGISTEAAEKLELLSQV